MKTFRTILAILTVLACGQVHAQALAVEKGRRVKIDYNLMINSQPVENTHGKEPLEFMVGGGNVIPGLENQMLGMKVGDEKKIIVAPQEAYGIVDPAAFKEVPKSSMPTDAELKPGLVVEVEDPQGGFFPGVVWEVREESVVINFNHPLAGQTLEFDVRVVDIQ
jgi:FKBP-type peptidyl-prolyl cis-trans isomerase SlyD